MTSVVFRMFSVALYVAAHVSGCIFYSLNRLQLWRAKSKESTSGIVRAAVISLSLLPLRSASVSACIVFFVRARVRVHACERYTFDPLLILVLMRHWFKTKGK